MQRMLRLFLASSKVLEFCKVVNLKKVCNMLAAFYNIPDNGSAWVLRTHYTEGAKHCLRTWIEFIWLSAGSRRVYVNFKMIIEVTYKETNKSHGLSPRTNYTDRATAACPRS
jgi:hypothetical protein